MNRLSPSQSTNGSSSFVLSIELLKKNDSFAGEWNNNLPQTGDIVQAIAIGNMTMNFPFTGWETRVQGILSDSFRHNEKEIKIRVRRGANEFVDLPECRIVASQRVIRATQYVLRVADDASHAFKFVNRTERNCLESQALRSTRMREAAQRNGLRDRYHNYQWERKMIQTGSTPNSTSFYTILFLPIASKTDTDSSSESYNDLEDTIARAKTWLVATQERGVPLVCMNVQTESLLIKNSGDKSSSSVDVGSVSGLTNVANSSVYGFEDFHGFNIGLVKAVRLWFCPEAVEAPIEVSILETDQRLGFSIDRTDEGFIYISNVEDGDDNIPSNRSGISELYKQASLASQLLVISRISKRKVLPWLIAPTGAILSFDVIQLREKLSLQLHANVTFSMRVFLGENSSNGSNTRRIPVSRSFFEATRCRDESESSRMNFTSESNSGGGSGSVPGADHVGHGHFSYP